MLFFYYITKINKNTYMSGGLDEALGGTYFSKSKYVFKDNRITPKNITELKENEVFIFGSNRSGIHGKGAAKQALEWGAIFGKSEGIQGFTYGIPTKDKLIKRTLSIGEIKPYVDRFIEYASKNNDKTFLVTEIGTGLAGHKHVDVAPLFQRVKFLTNVHLPENFWVHIK